MPFSQLIRKASLAQIAQAMDQRTQLLTGLKLGAHGKVSSYYGLLVEVAHLYRQILVKGPYPLFSVSHDRLYDEALGLKSVTGVPVLINRFSLDLRPVDVVLTVRVSHHKIAHCAAKKHTVHNSHYLGWSYGLQGWLISTQFLAYPVD